MSVAGLAAFLLLTAPAQAASITINFAGTINLTSVGGQNSTFTGSMTWDTGASPSETEPANNLATFTLSGYTLFFDGVNVTHAPSPDGNGNGLVVLNDSTVINGSPLDGLLFFASVDRPFKPGGVDGDLFLQAGFFGPTTMFSSFNSLPQNVNFLSTPGLQGISAMFFEPDDDALEEGAIGPLGTMSVVSTSVTTTPVPEPATMTLTALGLAGVIARARRSRRPRS